MCFYYLLLGHLLGDFTLQTDKIAENKTKYWKWNLVHTVIVTLCMLLFSIPFGLLIMGLVLFNGILHYLIDYYKSKLPIENPLWALIYFIIDQSLHIFIIYLISSFAVKNLNFFPFDESIVKFMITLVFTLSFSSILVQYILKLFFRGYNKKFFMDNEKNIGNFTRIFVFFTLYFTFKFSNLFILLIILAIAMNIFYYNRRWDKWMSSGYFKTKLLLDLTMSLTGFYLHLNI